MEFGLLAAPGDAVPVVGFVLAGAALGTVSGLTPGFHTAASVECLSRRIDPFLPKVYN